MDHNLPASVVRADDAAAIGLTEISKQMRQMRGTNQKQEEEIRRLKKQIEVLSETRGITFITVQEAFENAALKDADKELQHRYKEMKFRAEEAEAALRNQKNDKELHDRISELELLLATSMEKQKNAKRTIADLYSRLKRKEAEKSSLEQRIQNMEIEHQNNVMRSSTVSTETANVIRNLQARLAKLHAERKEVSGIVQDLTWKNEQVMQREQLALLENEKRSIELESKIQDISDLEQRLQSLHFAYSLVEKDMIEEKQKFRSTKAQQEAADLALVKKMQESDKKLLEQKRREKALKKQVLKATAIAAGAQVSGGQSRAMANRPPRSQRSISSSSNTNSLVPIPVAQTAPALPNPQNVVRITRTETITRKGSFKVPKGGVNIRMYANASCSSCSARCCDSAGNRLSDCRMCSVSGKWYCPDCKRQNLVRRSEGVYKRPECVGSKSRYGYPY